MISHYLNIIGFYAKKVIACLKAWLMVVGTIGFCLFILEEGSQIATFSTFMSKTNQDYELVLAAADIMTYNNNLIIAINKYIGWLNPLGYISYNQYAKAQKIYADECLMFVLRNQPELLNGREISITFTPKEILNLANKYMYRNGKISVMADNLYPMQSMSLNGRVEDGRIVYVSAQE